MTIMGTAVGILVGSCCTILILVNMHDGGDVVTTVAALTLGYVVGRVSKE